MTNWVFHADFHDVSRLNAPTEPSQTAVPVTAVGSQFEKCNQIYLWRKKNTFVMGSRTIHCLCFLRKPFVWAGYRGFFTSSYCYLFPFKNVSFCIHQKWCVYVKLLPIHYFALICNTLLRVYLFISMRTIYEYNVGDMID